MTATKNQYLMQPALTTPLNIGNVTISNRVLLAPLAGIGNWFVRLQARRHGAGLAVSEMISSFGLRHRNERTLREMLRIHPDEHPISVQLFGPDPEVMRSAAATAAEAGADLIDINMGCPVPKVCKSGAGVALLEHPDRAVAVARAAMESSGCPVTVKLRSGMRPGDRSGFELAVRLAEEAAVAAIAFHPRPADLQHKGHADYALARELAERLRAEAGIPMIISGGLRDAGSARRAYEWAGADAVMIARGCIGYPWIFEELTGSRLTPPSREEVIGEMLWTMDRAAEHFGTERANHWLRKLYPHYLGRLGISGRRAHPLQRAERLEDARRLIASLRASPNRARTPEAA